MAAQTHVAGLIVYRVQRGIEFLLLNDTFSPHKRHWTPPKGKVIGSEDDARCALRETQELTGISARDLTLDTHFRAEIRYLADSKPKRVVYILARAADHVRVMPGGEGITFSWFELRQAMDKALYKSMQEILKQAYDYVEDLKARGVVGAGSHSNSSRGGSRSSHGRMPLEHGMRGMQTNGGNKSNASSHFADPHGPDAAVTKGKRNDRNARHLDHHRELERDRPSVDSSFREGYGRDISQSPENANGVPRVSKTPRFTDRSDAPSLGHSDRFYSGGTTDRHPNMSENPLYKTRLCERFEKEGYCQYGIKCHFAHGQAELRSHRGRDHNGSHSQSHSQAPAVAPVSIGLTAAKGIAKTSASKLTSSSKLLQPMTRSQTGEVEDPRDSHSSHLISGKAMSALQKTPPKLEPKFAKDYETAAPTLPTTTPTTQPDNVQPEQSLNTEDSILLSLTQFFQRDRPLHDQLKEISRVEMRHDLPRPDLLRLLIVALFQDGNVKKDVSRRKPLLINYIRGLPDQITFLHAWETQSARSPQLLQRAPLTFKTMYDADLLEEDAILAWYEKSGPELRKRLKPFIDWLTTAEEDDE